jgi:hypothetical protein
VIVARSEKFSDLEAAVHARTARKQLPRVTDDGYVEYGLQVPQDYFAKKNNNGNRRSKGQQQEAGGADVEWILRASGVVSRGTPNFFNPPPTTTAAPQSARNKQWGSLKSLRKVKPKKRFLLTHDMSGT